MTEDQSVTEAATLRRIRRWIVIFIVCLVLSGLTAFPLEAETRWLAGLVDGSPIAEHFPAAATWVERVREGVADTNVRYPFLAYGTDWLAFAHLVIAIAFWGPYRDPVRNVWVIRWAMTACAAIIPLALICGPLRGIPLAWRFVDMSFGVIGVIPLLIVLRGIQRVERAEAARRSAQALAA
ncbi:hypothetical protein KCMC57_up55320 [Kitasatospora sp. CMC57]|uniref:Cytoplasmic membrane protein n=1 Tax=Kitasatospora sp. CMC57 TaxID=3231513 RepID=A0AB33K5P3_9ACTN